MRKRRYRSIGPAEIDGKKIRYAMYSRAESSFTSPSWIAKVTSSARKVAYEMPRKAVTLRDPGTSFSSASGASPSSTAA